ncbi:YceI family protein [Saccharopolyspora shandongensis]|uniref:Polyisoprenoid-binding protein YceI n=1 Tax=Saccharopolyspora shandongensis TaxID=418495 RepID=A0A1H2YPH9_9PSEU|nr:YceI family protein [Saccharopolyspora shandongensis]SDX07096.1 Polyisoprenoid-binding protein YceI [Saccharopolyspora shandongensis]
MDLGQRQAEAPGVAAASGAVTATVRGGDGWPVPEAVLTVIDGTGTQVARVQGDAQGSVVAAGLRAGAYTAIVTAVGHEPLARTTLVHDGTAATLGEVELRRVGGADLPSPGLWRIDPVHSSIQVTAKHLGISSIHGRFNEFAGEVRIGNPVESSTVEVRIAAAGIDTANGMRDDHLRSADFLDVERHPEITFRSTGLRPRGGDRWDLDGELTLCGVTRPVRLDTRFAGVGPDPWGGTRASATATTQLRREDFAMTFNQALQTGIAAIGTTLKVEIDIQAVREDG